LPCILTTDASKVAIAAILSQVKDGMEKPITFASRQINRARNNKIRLLKTLVKPVLCYGSVT
jgi:hypothetical protein